MGLISDIVTDVISNTVEDITEDAALVVGAGIVSAAAVTLDVAEKAAKGIGVVAKGTAKGVTYAAKGTAKGVKTVAKGTKKVADTVGKGINKANDFIKELNAPLMKKKLEKLKNDSEQLFLLSSKKENDTLHIEYYTPDVNLCFDLKYDSGKKAYYLDCVNGDRVASFEIKKKLFAKHINIYSFLNNKSHIFTKNDEDKTKYILDDEYRIVKDSLVSDYDYYYLDERIASLRSKPINDVDYALSIFNNDKDVEAMLLSVSQLIIK